MPTKFRGLFWRQNKISQIKSKEPRSESVTQLELNKCELTHGDTKMTETTNTKVHRVFKRLPNESQHDKVWCQPLTRLETNL